jgi:dipeptidyl-peptidase-4
MRNRLVLCWLAASFVTAGLSAGPVSASPKGTSLDTRYLRDHAETRGFMLGRPVKATPTPDGTAVLFLRAQARVPKLELYEFEVATARTRQLFTPEQVLKGTAEQLSPDEQARRERLRVSVGGFTDFQLSKDGSLILLSLSGKLYVVERATGKGQQLATGPGTLLDPKFSPDGKSVAYVLDHDVCALDLATQKERHVTTGGTERISHGLAEFVAQEEMERFSGYWWSPDSQSIAYEEADATEVEIWYVADPAHPEQTPHPSFYPRPGKANAKVRCGVVPMAGGDTVWLQWDRERYPYLTTVCWDKHGPLTLAVQTRDQKELVLLEANPATGQTAALLTERDAAWVNVRQDVPHWLSKDRGFLWASEQEQDWRLEWRGRRGELLRVLVPSSAGFQTLVDVDDAHGAVIFKARPDPTQSQAYRVSLDGGPPAGLTKGLGLHDVQFAENHSLYVHRATLLREMPRTTVHRADGTPLGEIPSVAENPPFVPQVELVKVGEGAGFYAAVVRPREFHPRQRYPVIVNVYGGPLPPSSSGTVTASMPAWLREQWLANQGFVVVSVDGRGTPGRGHDWERAISRHFGSVPLEDQVAGLTALGKRFRELDLKHVGIFGWSFGGYMSALAVLRRSDVFQAGVAGAPPVDWLDYDTHYTERYLGLPQSDPAPYAEGSLLTYAPGLQRPLLLIHGTADDNVYFRHTLKLANALFRAGRAFELLPLSGTTHMTPDPVVTEQLWSRIAWFFRAHLARTAPVRSPPKRQG